MKYTVTVNQRALSNTNLDLIDAAILDYLISFCSSRNKSIQSKRITINDEQFTWIQYENLLKDMPLLKIKAKSSLTPRIDRIKQAGFIELHQEPNKRLYVKLTDKVDTLYFEDVATDEPEEEDTVRVDEQKTGEVFAEPNSTVHLNEHNNNTNIINTIDTYTSDAEKTEVKEIVCYQNGPRTGNKTLKAQGIAGAKLDKPKKKKSYKSALTTECIEYLKEKLQLPALDGTETDNHEFCHHLMKKLLPKGYPIQQMEKVKEVIDIALEDPFWKYRLTSFSKLYNNAMQIVSSVRSNKFSVTYLT